MTKEVRDYEAPGFGFPVMIRSAPVASYAGVPYLDLPPRAVRAVVIRELVVMRARWCGDHVAFVRAELNLTQSELAAAVGLNGHTAVVAWEKHGNAPAGMREPMEFSLRLLAVERLRSVKEHAAALAGITSASVRDALRHAKPATTCEIHIRASDVEATSRAANARLEARAHLGTFAVAALVTYETCGLKTGSAAMERRVTAHGAPDWMPRGLMALLERQSATISWPRTPPILGGLARTVGKRREYADISV